MLKDDVVNYFAETGGWRMAVIFHRGRKWDLLLDIGTLTVVRRQSADKSGVRTVKGLTKTSVLTFIRNMRASYEKHNLRFSKNAVRRAIGTVKAA